MKTVLPILFVVLVLYKVVVQNLVSKEPVINSFFLVAAAGAATIYVDVQQNYQWPADNKRK